MVVVVVVLMLVVMVTLMFVVGVARVVVPLDEDSRCSCANRCAIDIIISSVSRNKCMCECSHPTATDGARVAVACCAVTAAERQARVMSESFFLKVCELINVQRE
jgi:hypothetical protein